MLSGNTILTISRDALITQAYRILGSLRTGGVATPDEIADAALSLNMMLKAWQAYGLQLWVIKKATLIPKQFSGRYDLGPGGAHVSLEMTKTTLRVDTLAGSNTLDVESTAGMLVNDNIGIVQIDGFFHWTTITSITNINEVVISTPLASDTLQGKAVYFYTEKIDRPHELLEVYRRDYDNAIDVPLIRLSRTDFYTLSSKETEGTPVNFYYDPQLGVSGLEVWPTAGAIFTADSVFILFVKKPFSTMDNANDDFEIPEEWYEAITYGLAERLAPMIGYPLGDRQFLKMEAQTYLDLALSFDVEHTDVTFVADESQRSR